MKTRPFTLYRRPRRGQPLTRDKSNKQKTQKTKSQPGSSTPVGRKGCPNGSTAQTVEQKWTHETSMADYLNRAGDPNNCNRWGNVLYRQTKIPGPQTTKDYYVKESLKRVDPKNPNILQVKTYTTVTSPEGTTKYRMTSQFNCAAQTTTIVAY